MTRTEMLINKLVKGAIRDLNISFPALVVGVQDLADGYIDVQPIVNTQNKYTLEWSEMPIIRGVRVVFPSTQNSTICFPVAQGDYVSLQFQSVNIQRFVEGDGLIHSPMAANTNNLHDVIAFVGFEPYQYSCFNMNNYKNELDMQSLNIVHNKGGANEVSFSLTSDGDVVVNTKNNVNFNCENFSVTATEKISLTAPLISENGR